VRINAPPFSVVAWEAARDGAITNDIDHAMLMTIGHAYGALARYQNARQLFINYLYTNGSPTFRENTLGLAGWLSETARHARDVQARIKEAVLVLGSAQQ
jgi:hypothetical protein